MAPPNPVIDKPILPKPHDPNVNRQAARSISPSRHQRNSSRSSSPDSSLRAIRNCDFNIKGVLNAGLLAHSVRIASPSDRSFGLHAIQLCKDVRAWAVLLESWDWPGTFAPPPEEDRESISNTMLADAGLSRSSTFAAHFVGSLPEQIVVEREAQVQDINTALLDIDVDQLRTYVHDTQLRSQQSGDTLGHGKSSDEFAVVITSAILKALPYLSWLPSLASEWTTRLTVLRKVPALLGGLSQLERDVPRCTTAPRDRVQRDSGHAETLHDHDTYSRPNMKDRLSKVGAMMDSMLDDLEGRPETLPDEWIDRLEELEAQFAAEPNCVQTNLLHSIVNEPSNPVSPILSRPSSSDDLSAKLLRSVSPEQRTESPILGHELFAVPQNIGAKSSNGSDTKGSAHAADEQEMIDRVISESQYHVIAPEEPPSAIISTVPSFPEFMSAIPTRSTSPKPNPHRTPGCNADQASNGIVEPSSGAKNYSPAKVLHRDSALSVLSEEPASEFDSDSRALTPALQSELERMQSPSKIKSPVKSLEHASAVFSRLFSRADVFRRHRSDPYSSRSSLRQRMTPSSISLRSSISSKRESDQSMNKGRSSNFVANEPAQSQASSAPTVSSLSNGGEGAYSHQPSRSLGSLDLWSPIGGSAHGELASPEILHADFFEKLFVDTLPGCPEMEPRLESLDAYVKAMSDLKVATAVSSLMPDSSTLQDMTHARHHCSCDHTRKDSQELTSDLRPSERVPPTTYFHRPLHTSPTRSVAPVDHDRTVTSRASIAPFEQYARSQVKTVNISRSPSHISPDETWSTLGLERSQMSPNQHGEISQDYVPSTSDLKYKGSLSSSASDAMVRIETPTTGMDVDRADFEYLPSDPMVSHPASNLEQVNETAAPVRTGRRPRKSPARSADRIDQLVGAVLQTLPGPIRFSSEKTNIGIAIDSPESERSTKHIVTAAKPSRVARAGTLVADPDIEIARRRSRNASDGKTYYLRLSGSTQPIRLYIRLVGEDDRAMVRVGGGWADLGEYLRRFAHHHGSKTLIDSQVTIERASSTSSSRETSRSRSQTPLGRSSSVNEGHTRASMQTPDLGSSSPATLSSGGTPGYTYSRTNGSKTVRWASDDLSSSPRAPSRDGGVQLDGHDYEKARSGHGAQHTKNGWVEEMLARAKKAGLETKGS